MLGYKAGRASVSLEKRRTLRSDAFGALGEKGKGIRQLTALGLSGENVGMPGEQLLGVARDMTCWLEPEGLLEPFVLKLSSRKVNTFEAPSIYAPGSILSASV